MNWILRYVFMLFLVSGAATAQVLQEPSIAGTVQDQTGAAIVGAAIRLLAQDGAPLASTVSNASGSFHFDGLKIGRYQVDAEQPGFRETILPVKTGAGTRNSLRIVMPLAALLQQVTVGGPAEGPHTSTEIGQNQSANIEDREALDHLPIFDQNYIAAMSRFLDDDATGTNGVSLVVNGVEANGPGVSSSAIKEVKINQNPYSALFSRPGRARIEITTECGTPDFHGSVNSLYRNSRFDARNAFAATKANEQRTYFEGSLTGPLSRAKKTTFLLSGQYDRDDRQAAVLAQGPRGPIQENVPNPDHHYFLSGRVFHSFKETNQFWTSYSYEHETIGNVGVGGTVLSEAGTNSRMFEHEVNVSYFYVASPKLLNQLHFLVGYNHDPTVQSIHEVPGINVSGAFTGGGAQLDTRRTEAHFDGTDVVTYAANKHEIKFGVDVPDISRRGFDDYRNLQGTYSFASLADYEANRPYSYLVQRGNGHVVFLEKNLAGFIEDTFRILPNLSLSGGMRYYWQNYFHDIPYNFAPRLSFAYAPVAKGKTVLRGGAGLFCDRSGPRPISDLLHFDGYHLVRLIATNTSYPATPDQIGGLPPGVVRLDPGARIPFSIQYGIGVERQATSKSSLSVSYVGSRGIHQFRSIDANAPLPPFFGGRPNSGLGQVRQLQSDGYQKSNALEITFRGRPVKVFTGQARYVLSKTYNNTAGIGYFPADGYAPQADWSRSDNDRRNKFDLLGTLNVRQLFDLGTALALYSGKPVNITTGNDENGDGLALDRPGGTPRNTLHGPANISLDFNLSREFKVTHKKESPSFQVSLNSFNVLNHTNSTTYIGVISSPFFGRAVQADPSRRMQVNLEFKF